MAKTGSSGRKMSAEGKDMLTALEGVRGRVYNDVRGLPTIGVGHLLSASELSSGKILVKGEEVRYRDGMTFEQIANLFEDDIREYELAVEQFTTTALRPPQFDALVSFAFNVGVRAFSKSTLLKLINRVQFDQVPFQFRRWIYSGGVTWDGLVKRREREIERWLA